MSLNNSGVARLVDVVAGQPVWEVETVVVPPLRVPGVRPGTEKNSPRIGAARLLFWYRWIEDEIRATEPGVIMMEAPAINGSGRVFDMGEAYGVIKLQAHCVDVPVYLVAPTSLKKYATGHGECDKQRMIDSAVAESGEQVRDEHQADAFWLGRIGWDLVGGGSADTAHRKSVIANLHRKGSST